MVLPAEYWNTLVLQQVGPQLRVELTLTETTGAIAMGMPGGSRRATRNDAFPRGTQTTLEDSHRSTESVGQGVDHVRGGHVSGCFTRDSASGSAAPSGVWLGADDGTVLFFPVSAGVDRSPLRPDADNPQLDADDQATLDAASWLMPKLPRELIAEFLGLGLPKQ